MWYKIIQLYSSLQLWCYRFRIVFRSFLLKRSFSTDLVAAFHTRTMTWRQVGFLNNARSNHRALQVNWWQSDSFVNYVVLVGGFGQQYTETCLLGETISCYDQEPFYENEYAEIFKVGQSFCPGSCPGFAVSQFLFILTAIITC